MINKIKRSAIIVLIALMTIFAGAFLGISTFRDGEMVIQRPALCFGFIYVVMCIFLHKRDNV